MSLINKMLQDLDARQAAGMNAIVTHHVRALPPGADRPSWWGIAAAAAALVLVVAAGAMFVLPIARRSALGAGRKAARLRNPGRCARDPTRSSALLPTASAAPEAPLLPGGNGIHGRCATPVAARARGTVSRPTDSRSRPSWAIRRRRALAATLGRPPNRPVASESRARIESPSAGNAARLPTAPAVADPAAAAATTAPAAAPPAPKPARTGQGPPRIEKSARELTAQERAANDYRLAVSLLNDGRPGAATESLRAALRSDPAFTDARLLLSNQLVEQRQLSEARSVLQDGLARDPAQPRLAMPLARIQVELGDSGAAVETLARAAPAAAGQRRVPRLSRGGSPAARAPQGSGRGIPGGAAPAARRESLVDGPGDLARGRWAARLPHAMRSGAPAKRAGCRRNSTASSSKSSRRSASPRSPSRPGSRRPRCEAPRRARRCASRRRGRRA